MYLNGPEQYADHIRGKKHLKSVKKGPVEECKSMGQDESSPLAKGEPAKKGEPAAVSSEKKKKGTKVPPGGGRGGAMGTAGMAGTGTPMSSGMIPPDRQQGRRKQRVGRGQQPQMMQNTAASYAEMPPQANYGNMGGGPPRMPMMPMAMPPPMPQMPMMTEQGLPYMPYGMHEGAYLPPAGHMYMPYPAMAPEQQAAMYYPTPYSAGAAWWGGDGSGI